MKPKDRIYFLIDRFTEISGTVVTYDEESGKVSVKCDVDGEIFQGTEEHARPNDDVVEEGTVDLSPCKPLYEQAQLAPSRVSST